jgi:hypothetical protein
VAECSVNTAFALLKGHNVNSGRTVNALVPEPEKFTIDFAVQYQRLVKRIMLTPSIQLLTVSKDKIYPIVINTCNTGAHVGVKCLKALENTGLGRIADKCFKRNHPDNNECEDRENMK